MSKFKLVSENKEIKGKGCYSRLICHDDQAAQYWCKKGWIVSKVWENKEGWKEIEVICPTEEIYKGSSM